MPTDDPQRRGRWRRARDGQPLRRASEDRMLAGVAGGVARRLGFDPTLVRIVIALLAVGGGTGVVCYMLAWLVLRRDDEETSIAQRSLRDPRAMAQAIGLATLVVAVMLALAAAGLSFVVGLVWPVALASAGLVAIWRHADEDDRAAIRKVAGHLPALPEFGVRSRRAAIIRVVVGGGLVLVGLAGFFVSGDWRGQVRQDATAAVGIVAGFLVVFGPFWMRLARDLTEERRERVRSQERADMAAHVHDSVLQTLALIQRRADDPRQVVALARAQERELRQWLFQGRSPGTTGEGETHFAGALSAVERDVEATHGVAVEAVTVGDCELDEDISALLAAGREAAVNAAKWSGATTVSLFAEVEPAQVSLFVRDRGAGFDPETVAPDRRGITESIRGRVTRHGGTATIRSVPGEGTEVELTMPRRNGRS